MPRANSKRRRWLTAKKSPAGYERLAVPYREEPGDGLPIQLPLPFPGATVPAIRLIQGSRP